MRPRCTYKRRNQTRKNLYNMPLKNLTGEGGFAVKDSVGGVPAKKKGHQPREKHGERGHVKHTFKQHKNAAYTTPP